MNTAKIIGITKPLIAKSKSSFPQYEPDVMMTVDEFVAYVARVSNPSNQTNTLTSQKLLRYLAKNKHWSPFEMVNVVMEIETTRDIARQILRHRSFSFQEFCVAEGTLITTLTKSGKSKKVPIENLYKRWINSQYSSMSDNLIRVFDETAKTFVARKINEVFETGVKPCFRLILENGKVIECTEEHKILSFDGFKRLKDIDVQKDFIACNGIPVYQSYDWLINAKSLCIQNKTGVSGIAEMAGTKYQTIRKWLKRHSLSFTKMEVASYTSVWNKGIASYEQPMFGKKHKISTRNAMSEKALERGETHNFFKSGNYTKDNVSWRKYVVMECGRYKKDILERQKYKCAISGVDLTLENSDLDHIYPVCFRPDLALDMHNLRVISRDDHNKKTNEETMKSKYTVSYHKIKSIEFVGNKQTYDIEVNHVSHNYIANGIVTHNSQRYADPTKDLGFVTREARLQDTKNRQNSIEVQDTDLEESWKIEQLHVIERANMTYDWAIKNGIAKEQARSVLPEGLTVSRLYMNGNLRSWVHYCQVRMDPATQKEHRNVATDAWYQITEHFSSLKDCLDIGEK